MENISEFSSIDDLFKKTVLKIGELLHSENFVVTFDNENNSISQLFSSENFDKKIFNTINLSLPSEIFEFWKEQIYINNKPLIIDDILDINYIEPLNNFVEKLKIRSFAIFPIIYNNKITGMFGIYRNAPQAYSNTELLVIEEIAGLLSQVFNLNKINSTIRELKKQSDREKSLRKLITNIRKNNDSKKIKNDLVFELGKYLDCDRCFVFEYNNNSESVVSDDKIEFLKSDKTKSFFSTDLESNVFKYWLDIVLPIEDELLIPNTKNYIKKNYLQGTEVEKRLKDLDIKSCIGIPVYRHNEILIMLMLQWCRPFTSFCENDIELINIARDNASVALSKAYLYETLKKQIKIERALRSDESILINRKLAGNVGLNCAITYSVLANAYYYMKEEGNLLSSGYFIKTIDDIIQYTCLSENAQNESIQKLSSMRLISIKKAPKDGIYFKITEDEEVKNSFLHGDNGNNMTIDSHHQEKTEKAFYNINDLCDIYSKYYSKNSVKAVKYFMEKSGQIVKSQTESSSRHYFSVLCRSLYDFMSEYNLSLSHIKKIIDEWFGKNTDKCSDCVVDFGLSNKVLSGRLKKIMAYRLHESEILATDFSSKLDFHSNIDFENNNTKIKPIKSNKEEENEE